ncbi:MAG: transporter, partial [Elusimicrobiaceae bacterium]
TVTGFIRLNLPTDTGDGTTYFTHGYGLQFSVPIKPVMAHVNASYNFVVENNNYKPGNYFDYGINAEYYPYDSKLNLFLEYTGQIGSDGEWHGREQIDSGIQHMELTPGLGYMIDRDTHMQFSYTRTVWGKNADVQNIFRISATLKFPKLSSSFY